MAIKYFDNVRHLIATPGTGDITLGTVPAGWRGFGDTDAVDTDQPPYELRDGVDWEYGYLTLNTSVTAATRTVISSSNANAPLDLSGGAILTSAFIADILDNNVLSFIRTQAAIATQKRLAQKNLGIARGTDIAAAATIDLDSATGDFVNVTGNTNITGITLADGAIATVRFTGTPTLTNGASLLLPEGVDIEVRAGDFASFRGGPAGVVYCVFFQRFAGIFTLRADQAVSSLSANTDNWALTNLSTKMVFHVGATAAIDVTGITAGYPGQVIVLINESAFTMAFRSENAGSSAANRLRLFADVLLGQYQSLMLWYDPTNSRWVQFSSAGNSGGGFMSLNKQNVDTDFTIPDGFNGLSVGPITTDAGASVTVPSGSKWVVI